MPRVKKIIIAVEGIHPNTLISEDDKYLHNFIAFEADAMNGFKEQAQRKLWDDKKSPAVVEKIMKDWKNPKKLVHFFYDDEIAIMDAKMSDKFKLKDDYVYRVREMDDCSVMDDIYITYNEIFTILNKKIKSKCVDVIYNGNREKIEYNEKELGNIIARMVSGTNSILISPNVKNKCEDKWFEITIFKNLLSVASKA